MLISDYFLILKSKLFNKKYYLEQYPDVRLYAKNALYHYLKYGWKEGRNPSKDFDTNLYINCNKDVGKSNINPLIHYLKYGKKEGRKIFSTTYITYSTEITSQNGMPLWIINEMKAIGREIDPNIYPSTEKLSLYQHYSYPVHTKPGEIYQEILNLCQYTHYTHCFAIPWLKKGGADFVALLHIKFAAEQPNSKVLLLLTEPADSPWLSRVPEGVDVLDLSKYVWELLNEDFLKVITRLLIQLKIDVLHIINSRYVWDVVRLYGLALRNQTKIFASVYCDDYDMNGQPVGFAREYLPSCYMHLSKVFTDSMYYPSLLQNIYGYPKSLFQVLNSPVNNVKMNEKNSQLNKKVLWAGRLDRQKRPDLLLKIVKGLPDVTFSIYGEPLLESPQEIISELKELSNVEMKGSFNGVEELPFDKYSAFLYTSQWDGIPTIIISAALSGIPIVASNVGGVGEVVNGTRGYPINNIENIDEYIKAIQTILNNGKDVSLKAINAQEYINENHTEKVFFDNLRKTENYISNNLKGNKND